MGGERISDSLMRNLLRWLWIPLIALVVVALDQWTKSLIERSIPLNGGFAPFPALERYFNIVHFTNTGAAFGLLRGQGGLFAVVGIVVIVVVLIYSRNLSAGDWATRTLLGLQLGGAAGNLVDRLQTGHVTDFLLFTAPVGNRIYQWPAFNVADTSIVVGTILLVLLLLWQDRVAARKHAVAGFKGADHPAPTTETDPS
jgi:signal peptidase II